MHHVWNIFSITLENEDTFPQKKFLYIHPLVVDLDFRHGLMMTLTAWRHIESRCAWGKADHKTVAKHLGS